MLTLARPAASLAKGWKKAALWEALLRTRLFPMAIIPVIRQGEQQGTLDDSLRTAAKMLEDRVHNRSTLVIQVLPPLIFLLVAS